MVVSDFQSSVVRICDECGQTKGTGFFITESGHLLTNDHVICGIDEQQIRVQFGDELVPVSVVARFERPDDFALLQIKQSPTPHCSLGEDFAPGDVIRSQGFHRTPTRFPEGFPVAGKVSGETRLIWMGATIDVIVIKDIKARKGLSGAPAYNDRTKRVVGILSFIDGKLDGLAIPIRAVLQRLPHLRSLLPLAAKTRFTNEVSKLYDLLGCSVERDIPLSGGSDKLDLLVETKARAFDKPIRLAVKVDYRTSEEPVDYGSTSEFLSLFGRARQEHNVDYAVLVTNTNFDLKAKDLGGRDDSISLLTYSQLLAKIIDVDEYIKGVIYDYEHYAEYEHQQRGPIIDFMERDNLYEYYLPLNAREMTGGYRGSIEDFVTSWLEDKNRNHLSILGDFGTGKSSFCLRLTYEMAKKYQSDPPNSRIPLFIPLKNFSSVGNIENMLSTLITDRYQMRVNSFADLLKMLEIGKFLLIFDGFDEMTAGQDRIKTSENLEILNKLAVGESKVILTCRTHYFTSQKAIASALAPDQDTDLMRVLRSRPQFTVLLLEELQEEQIKTYLRNRTAHWEWLWEEARQTYDLLDLMKRPLLLKMVVTTAPELKKKTHLRAIDLYEAYSEIWIDINDWRSTMTPAGKVEFMKEMAYLMYSQDERQELHYTELAAPIQEYFKTEISRAPMDAYENDVRTCSFLNRDSDGNYRFIHKSFMEFFVAQKLSTEMERNICNNFDERHISPEIAVFLVQYLQRTGTIPADLWQLVNECRGKSFDSVHYRATNTIMLLRQMCKEDEFAVGDFSKLPLRRADFANLNLEGAKFTQADLELATFNHSVLSDADFGHAILRDVSLGENNAIYGMDFNPSQGTLAIVGSDRGVRIWDVHSRNFLRTLTGHENNVKAVAYSCDGVHLVSGGLDRTVRLWIAKTGKEILRLRGHEQGVRAVAYCRGGSYVASGGYDNTARLWEIEPRRGESRKERKLEGHRGPVYSVAFNPSRAELATASADGTIRVWDLETGAEETCLEQSGVVGCIAYSSDGGLLAGGDGDEGVRIWRCTAGVYEPMDYFALAGSLCFSLCFSSNQRYLAGGDQAGRIFIWDMTSRRQYWNLDSAHIGVVNALRFIEDDRLLASGAEDGVLKLWDIGEKNPDPIATEGVQEDLRVKGMKINEAQGLSDARVVFLTAKGAIV